MIAGNTRPTAVALVIAIGLSWLVVGEARAATKPQLVVLPLLRAGPELSEDQAATLSESWPTTVFQTQGTYGAHRITPSDRTALWDRLRAVLRINADTDKIAALMGKADALLFGQVGNRRVVLNLQPKGGRLRRAQMTLPAGMSGQRLVQQYARALEKTAKALFSADPSQPIGVLFETSTIAGLDPHQVIRKHQVLHRSRVALESAIGAVNASNAESPKNPPRQIRLVDPKAAHGYRCWLQVDYKDTVIMNCEQAQVGGAALFWQAAMTNLMPWEQLIPLAAKIYDEATGRGTTSQVRRAERIVFLVDNSGSLVVNDYLPYVNSEPRQSRRYRAVASLVEALGRLDTAPDVGILVFAGATSQQWFGWFAANDATKRARALAGFERALRKISEGGTDIAGALRTAAEKSAGPASMLLLTDGAQTVLPEPLGYDAVSAREQEQALRYVIDVARDLHRQGSWAIHVVNMQIINLEALRHAVKADIHRVVDYWSRADFFAEDEVPEIESFISEINASNLKVGDLNVLAEIAGPGTYWQSQSEADDLAIFEGDLFGVLRLPVPRIHVLCSRQNKYDMIVCDVPYLKPGDNPLVVRNHFNDQICSAEVAKLSRGARTKVSFRQISDDVIELDVAVAVSGTTEAGSIGNVNAEIELHFAPAGRPCP